MTKQGNIRRFIICFVSREYTVSWSRYCTGESRVLAETLFRAKTQHFFRPVAKTRPCRVHADLRQSSRLDETGLGRFHTRGFSKKRARAAELLDLDHENTLGDLGRVIRIRFKRESDVSRSAVLSIVSCVSVKDIFSLRIGATKTTTVQRRESEKERGREAREREPRERCAGPGQSEIIVIRDSCALMPFRVARRMHNDAHRDVHDASIRNRTVVTQRLSLVHSLARSHSLSFLPFARECALSLFFEALFLVAPAINLRATTFFSYSSCLPALELTSIASLFLRVSLSPSLVLIFIVIT